MLHFVNDIIIFGPPLGVYGGTGELFQPQHSKFNCYNVLKNADFISHHGSNFQKKCAINPSPQKNIGCLKPYITEKPFSYRIILLLYHNFTVSGYIYS